MSLNAQDYKVSSATSVKGDFGDMIHLVNTTKKGNVLNITEDKVYIGTQEFDIVSKDEFLAREADNTTMIAMNLTNDKLGIKTKIVVIVQSMYTGLKIYQIDEEYNTRYITSLWGLKQK